MHSLYNVNILFFQDFISSTWVSFYWLPNSFQEYEINFSFQSSHLHFAYLAALLQNLSVIKEYSVHPYTTARTSQVKLVVKNPSVNADVASIPGSGRSPGGGKATHSSILALRVPRTRGAWQATVCRISVSQTWLKQLSTHAHTHTHIHTYTHTLYIYIYIYNCHCPNQELPMSTHC